MEYNHSGLDCGRKGEHIACVLYYSTHVYQLPVFLQAHCYYVVLKSFNEAIDTKGLSPANEAIMRKLCSLYAMYWMVQRSGEFMSVSASGARWEGTSMAHCVGSSALIT